MTDYGVGVDLGTTFAAAATFGAGVTEAIRLEDDELVSPSVLRPVGGDGGGRDGHWLIGRAAAGAPGSRVGRFKRLVGTHPLLVDGVEHWPEELLAIQLDWVLRRVVERRGARPAGVVLTHPSNWGPHRMTKFEEVARSVGLAEVSFLPEPVAAAVFHASRSSVEPGHVVAVYDLGGGTTDVSILHKEPEQFVLMATSGTDSGSVDFDDALLDLVEERAGFPEGLDASELLDLVAEAKVRLSSQPEIRLTVTAEGVERAITITVEDLETVAEPLARQGVAHLTTALRHAGVEPSEVGTMLLTGGGGGMPLVRRLVAEVAGRPPTVSDHPKLAVAYGAAISAGATAGLLSPPTEPVERTVPAGERTVPAGTGAVAEWTDTKPIVVDTTGLTSGPEVVVFDVPTGPPTRLDLATIVARADAGRIDEAPEPISLGGGRIRDQVILLVGLLVVIGLLVALALR